MKIKLGKILLASAFGLSLVCGIPAIAGCSSAEVSELKSKMLL